jgi:hypothetical protein
LKDLFRDYVDARASSLAAAVPTERRDAGLAMGVCDHPKARARVNKLEITTEETISNRGRRFIDLSLPELLWLPYKQEPELGAVYEWVKSISVERADLSKGYFLTADALRRACRDDEARRANLDTIDVARAVVIFAGLLPERERLALFESAVEAGIGPIAKEFEDKSGTTSRFPNGLPGAPPGAGDESAVATAHDPDELARGGRKRQKTTSGSAHGSIVRPSSPTRQSRSSSNAARRVSRRRIGCDGWTRLAGVPRTMRARPYTEYPPWIS